MEFPQGTWCPLVVLVERVTAIGCPIAPTLPFSECPTVHHVRSQAWVCRDTVRTPVALKAFVYEDLAGTGQRGRRKEGATALLAEGRTRKTETFVFRNRPATGDAPRRTSGGLGHEGSISPATFRQHQKVIPGTLRAASRLCGRPQPQQRRTGETSPKVYRGQYRAAVPSWSLRTT